MDSTVLSHPEFPYTSTFTSLARVIRAPDADRFIAKASLQPLRALLPEGVDIESNPDVLFVAADGAVAGLVNLNGDSVDLLTGIEIHRTALYKFLSTDHDRSKVCGAIVSAGLTRFGSNEPLTDDEALALKEPVNMAVAAVIWKMINAPLAKYLVRVGDAQDDFALSLSWEIGFRSYAIAKGAKNLFDAQIIEKGDPQFDALDKCLRANGGKGVAPDGQPVYRVIKGPAVILGYSVVDKPAAEVKGILPIVSSDASKPADPAQDAAPASATTSEYQIETTAPVPLADGEYPARRYGYVLNISDSEYATKTGVRCTESAAIQLRVRVQNGAVYQLINAAVEPTVQPAPEPTPVSAAPAQTEPETTASAAAPIQPVEENFINSTEIRVTPNTPPMKIDSIFQMDEATWSKLIEAKAGFETIKSAIEKGNSDWEQKLNAEKNLVKTIEDTKTAAESRAAELEKSLNDVRKQLDDLKAAQAAAEKDQKFQERMASFDEEYDLDDEDRQLIASDIKDLSDDAFTAYAKKQSKLMCAKKKSAAKSKKADKPADKSADKGEKPGDKTDDSEPDDDEDDAKGKKSKASVDVKEALASAKEIDGQAVVPPGEVKTDTSLAAQLDEAFGDTIKVGGKTIRDRRAEKAAKQPKE